VAHFLQKSIGRIRRRVRALWLVHALACSLALSLGAALTLMALDYTIRLEDRGLRIMATALWFAVCLGALYRFIWNALRAPLTPLDVALRLERRFPILSQRLASSVEFLDQSPDDPRAGSAELRRRVVHETQQLLEPLDLSEAIDQRPMIRALSAAMTVLLLAGVLMALDPRLALVGIRRLLHPLGADAWPQTTHLALRQVVRKVAIGQPFEVQVVSRTKMPREVWMLYRHPQSDGGYHEEKQLLPISGGVAVARRESVTQPFAYRAIGGDDRSMPWIEVEVLQPPALTSVSFMLHFPPYTGWTARLGERHLRAIAGTRVALEGEVNKPLRSAKIVRDDGQELPLTLAGDRTRFALPVDADRPLVIDKTGAYWFVFEDTTGLTGGEDVRYEMRAIADLEPNVTLDAPQTSAYVAPSAIVPIRVTATDDLAIKSIGLRFLRSDQSDQGDQEIVLYQGPAAAAVSSGAPSRSEELGERRTVDYRWELEPLKLPPGTSLTLHATASDYRPALGLSTPRQITVMTLDEIERRLEDREAALLAELGRVLKLAQAARMHVGAVQIQAEEVGSLGQSDLDRLQAGAMTQRQVSRALSSRDQGLPAQWEALAADIRNNGLDHPDLTRRTELLIAELDRLQREPLPAVERALTEAEKSIRSNGDSRRFAVSTAARHEIKQAAANQDDVIASLTRLLGEFSKWEGQRRAARNLSELRQLEQALAERTTEIGRATLAKSLDRLSAQERADLKKLASEQQEIARRFETAQQEMIRSASELQAASPADAQAITDAIAEANDKGVLGKMRESAANIELNQIGQASTRQGQVLEDLDELLDILSNRREHELARLVKKLKESEAELNRLREHEAALRAKLEELAKQSDSQSKRQELQRLARQQRQLEEQVARMARLLRRLQAEQSAASLGRAGESMGRAGDQQEQGNATDALDSVTRAQRDLDEARKELAQRRRQAERDLAFEQLTRLQDMIVGLRDRQAATLNETQRLDEARRTSGAWNRGQLQSLAETATTQENLAREANVLAGRLSGAQAFTLAMRGAGSDMQDAAARLRKQESGRSTVEKQQRALSRLGQLLSALEPDQEDIDAAVPQDDAGGGGAAGGEEARGEQIPDVAQLKLIKLMQVDLNDRTQALSKSLGQAQVDSQDVAEELSRLSEEQGRLADAIRNLGAAAEEPIAGPGDLRDPLEEAEQ
jgi:hypothetical protein